MLKYEIKNVEVMQLLSNYGFKLIYTSPGIWIMESPKTISNTQARKLISACIKLHSTAKELERVHKKYNHIVNCINNINISS
jgi:hypothetical protein